jgi:hypothetical protein
MDLLVSIARIVIQRLVGIGSMFRVKIIENR